MLFQETGFIIIFLRIKSFASPDSTVLHLKHYVRRFIIQNDFRVQGGALVHIMGWHHTKSPNKCNYAKATAISHLFQQFSIRTNIYSLHWTDTDNLSTTVSKQNKWSTAERNKESWKCFYSLNSPTQKGNASIHKFWLITKLMSRISILRVEVP